MKDKNKDRRRFMRKSIQAMVIAPALAACHTRSNPQNPTENSQNSLLPGDIGTRDTEAYGSISEE